LVGIENVALLADGMGDCESGNTFDEGGGHAELPELGFEGVWCWVFFD